MRTYIRQFLFSFIFGYYCPASAQSIDSLVLVIEQQCQSEVLTESYMDSLFETYPNLTSIDSCFHTKGTIYEGAEEICSVFK